MKSQGCQNPYNPDFDAYIYRHISNSNFYKYQPKYVKFPCILGIECIGITEAAQPDTGIMVGQPVAALLG
jgi:hypothetical protein